MTDTTRFDYQINTEDYEREANKEAAKTPKSGGDLKLAGDTDYLLFVLPPPPPPEGGKRSLLPWVTRMPTYKGLKVRRTKKEVNPFPVLRDRTVATHPLVAAEIAKCGYNFDPATEHDPIAAPYEAGKLPGVVLREKIIVPVIVMATRARGSGKWMFTPPESLRPQILYVSSPPLLEAITTNCRAFVADVGRAYFNPNQATFLHISRKGSGVRDTEYTVQWHTNTTQNPHRFDPDTIELIEAAVSMGGSCYVPRKLANGFWSKRRISAEYEGQDYDFRDDRLDDATFDEDLDVDSEDGGASSGSRAFSAEPEQPSCYGDRAHYDPADASCKACEFRSGCATEIEAARQARAAKAAKAAAVTVATEVLAPKAEPKAAPAPKAGPRPEPEARPSKPSPKSIAAQAAETDFDNDDLDAAVDRATSKMKPPPGKDDYVGVDIDIDVDEGDASDVNEDVDEFDRAYGKKGQ